MENFRGKREKCCWGEADVEHCFHLSAHLREEAVFPSCLKNGMIMKDEYFSVSVFLKLISRGTKYITQCIP